MHDSGTGSAAGTFAAAQRAVTHGFVELGVFAKVTSTAQGKRVVAVQIWDTPYTTSQGRVFVAVSKAFDGIHWGVLRTIDPDLDAARDAVVTPLQSAGLIEKTRLSAFVRPVVGRSLTGNPFFSRGEIQLVVVVTRDNAIEIRQGGSATRR